MKSETPREDMFLERIRKLERRLDALDAARNINGATIDAPGALQVRDAAGVVRAYIGQIDPAGRIGMALIRDDGSPAVVFATFTGDPTPHAVVQLYDRSGNLLYDDDETTGQGLSRPYIPIPFKPTSQAYELITNPSVVTNAFDLFFFKQHPRAEVAVTAYCNTAGATGTVDLYDGGTGTVIDSAAITSTAGNYALNGPVSGSHMDYKTLNLRVRRTSGSGDITVVLLYSVGKG